MNMSEILQKNDLIYVCAMQWKACVDRSLDAFNNIPDERKLIISYERFVENPVEELDKICKFLGENFSKEELVKVVGNVSTGMVGKSKNDFSEKEFSGVEKIVSSTMNRLGYSQ